MRRTLLALTALVALKSSAAFAYYGWVTGNMYFYDTRVYTAAEGEGPYTTSMKNTNRPIRYAKVYLFLNGTSTQIGSGTTDGNGYFSIFWSSTVYNPSVNVKLQWESSFNDPNGNTRYRIATSTGGTYVSWAWAITASTYATTNYGGIYYGTNKVATLFATATDFWVTIGQTSTNLLNRLGNVQVRFPVASASTGATISRTEIDMPDNWTVTNNSTLSHEFGHVVQEIQFEQDGLSADCSWGDPAGTSSHGWDTSEWQSCAGTEGWADFVAAATFFYPGASNPTSYGYDIENGCSGWNEWSESNTARMFWDIYDSPNDGNDGLRMPFYWFVDKWNIFPDGTANRQDRETQSNKNGLNAWDFYYHALYSGNGTNVDIQPVLEKNCLYGSEW